MVDLIFRVGFPIVLGCIMGLLLQRKKVIEERIDSIVANNIETKRDIMQINHKIFALEVAIASSERVDATVKEPTYSRTKVSKEEMRQLELENLLCSKNHNLDDFEVGDE